MLKIKDLSLNTTMDIFLLVAKVNQKETTNGKPYIEFLLDDGTGSIEGKRWDAKIEDLPDIAAGKVIKVRASVREWNNKPQLNILNCRAVADEDKIDTDEFIRKAPVDASEMFNFIMDTVNNFSNDELRILTAEAMKRSKEKLLYFPGAQFAHHNYKAGLLYHMTRMLQLGIKSTEIYGDVINKDLLYAGIILHDIGKLEELDAKETGIVEDYTTDGKLLGHVLQGIEFIALLCHELCISRQTERLIEHIIASHHGDETMGAVKKPMFFEAELIHHLDMIDSRAFMFEEIEGNTENDSFSDKAYFLGNRQIYKHNLL